VEFLTRFTPQERIAINDSTDKIVMDFARLLNVADTVDITDANTNAGVNYLVHVNLLTPERANEILAK
jgi:hypothetical protein